MDEAVKTTKEVAGVVEALGTSGRGRRRGRGHRDGRFVSDVDMVAGQ